MTARYPSRVGHPARRKATYADVLAAPTHLVAEIVDGVLSTQPRPAARHAFASSALGGELHGPFMRGRGGPGGWILLDEPELHLAEDVLVPDLAGWRRERLPALDVSAIDVAPDWVCEVLSPSTTGRDRAAKLPAYAKAGVLHAWLVDPVARTLEVLRRVAEHWVIVGTHHGDAVVHAEPFVELSLELTALWIDGAPGADR